MAASRPCLLADRVGGAVPVAFGGGGSHRLWIVLNCSILLLVEGTLTI